VNLAILIAPVPPGGLVQISAAECFYTDQRFFASIGYSCFENDTTLISFVRVLFKSDFLYFTDENIW
jgi:hypothetical protein